MATYILSGDYFPENYWAGYYWPGANAGVNIVYTEVLPFSLEMVQTASYTAQSTITAVFPVNLTEVVTMSAYQELSD